MPAPRQSKTPRKKGQAKAALRLLNPNAAGIDIGATMHYVAVPSDRAENPVRCFGTHTADLHALARWLHECQVTSVALESTGSYWIALYQVLERAGFKVVLCNARHVKNLPGRKTDVADWLARSRSSRPSACLSAAYPAASQPPVLPNGSSNCTVTDC